MMNIILLGKKQQRPLKIHLSRTRAVALLVAVLLVPLSLVSYLGFFLGSEYGQTAVALNGNDAMKPDGAGNKQSPRDVQETINALTARLGALQAQVIRLNALGKRLVGVAGLEKGEFDFSSPPPQGGPEEPNVLAETPLPLPALRQDVDRLNQQLNDRQEQLSILDTVFRHRNLLDEVLPKGRPVSDGWISSYYGYRTNPFSGGREWHPGVDIAGKMGEPVVAVAAGIVTYAGKDGGYGNLVQINHGNGFVTRYGHNSKVLVKVGETVSKGQEISLMGSTGRSTGPHVHFEVWRSGRRVNPIKYLRAAK
ncbi:MAG: M23 family metallopeptidase [Gammaproteobacteria bacterium]|jgi:murein DD-endopeptidase MepM/ murein hydrolase activator NlpD